MTAEMGTDLRAHWDERYRSGQTPWDTGITPPEVQRFWTDAELPRPGAYALDIGCGSGLNTLFLARQGLCAIGVDLSGRALMLAHRRLRASVSDDSLPQTGKAVFVQADVSRLPVGPIGAVYALDIGCLHSLPDARRPLYARGIWRALCPGGYYHVYAFDRDKISAGSSNARGMDDGEVAALFGDALQIVTEERGIPSERSRSSSVRQSRWYLLQKR